LDPADIRALEASDDQEPSEGHARLLTLAVTAAVAGAVTGLTGACFRLVLREADSSRVDVMSQLRPLGAAGVLIAMLIVAACAALARGLVRLAPEAGGSGVQRVEAVMRGEARPASSRVLPVKFVGGALALGAGMVLGREGPTVQMGAVIGDWFAKQARLSTVDLRRLQAATAERGWRSRSVLRSAAPSSRSRRSRAPRRRG